jgi:hypothetical protein
MFCIFSFFEFFMLIWMLVKPQKTPLTTWKPRQNPIGHLLTLKHDCDRWIKSYRPMIDVGSCLLEGLWWEAGSRSARGWFCDVIGWLVFSYQKGGWNLKFCDGKNINACRAQGTIRPTSPSARTCSCAPVLDMYNHSVLWRGIMLTVDFMKPWLNRAVWK